MAVAATPAARRAVPVFVTKLGEDGNFSMSSLARSAGGCVANERLKLNSECVRRKTSFLTRQWCEEEQPESEGKSYVELEASTTSTTTGDK